MNVTFYGCKGFLAFCFIFILASCGGGSSSQSTAATPPTPVNDSSTFTQSQVMNAIYQDQRVPPQFYREPQRDPGLYYSIKHVKNSVLSSSSAPANSTNTAYELCTNDFITALNWSELDNQQSNVHRNLIGNSDNDVYFEFTRTNSNQGNVVQFNRVFKCSNLNKDPTLFGGAQEVIGVFNNLLAGKEQFRKTIEYLWYLSPKNNYGNSVLDSKSAETEGRLSTTIISAHLKVNGSVNKKCDLIEVEKFEYSANKTTGIMTVTQTQQSSFYSKYTNNIAQLCLDPQ